MKAVKPRGARERFLVSANSPLFLARSNYLKAAALLALKLLNKCLKGQAKRANISPVVILDHRFHIKKKCYRRAV